MENMRPAHRFLKNMWIMRRADKEYLKRVLAIGNIEQEEYADIVTTRQITEEVELNPRTVD